MGNIDISNIDILAISINGQYLNFGNKILAIHNVFAIDMTLKCLYWYIPLQTTFVEDMHGCRKESLLKNLSKIPKI